MDPGPAPLPTPSLGRERIIENAIIARPDLVGFPDSLALRNWRVAPTSGRLDLALFPKDSSKDIILIEAKAAASPDGASKVIGQLLMYYAGVLALGSDGLECLKSYAAGSPDEARATSKKSLLKLSGGVRPGKAAWARLSGGTPVAPDRVALFLAIDNEPHHALRPTLAVLRARHNLPIGLVIVRNGVVTVVDHPAG